MKADFGLIKSFDIDHGELNGLTPQECFVLGYELGEIDRMLDSLTDESCSRPIHAQNEGRICKSCEDSGREFRLEWMPEDKSESWMMLYVK